MTPKRLPRYEEIARELRAMVAAARPGDRLPSDAELCARYSVSRMTARQAVDQLVRDELVVRRRGLGTFVASRPVPRLLGSPLSFTESMRRRGLRASSRVLVRSRATPSEADVAALQLDGPDEVLVLERLRLADGVPMAIERAVIHPSVAEGVPEDDELTSLHAAFERLGHLPTRALATVSARIVTTREAEILELPKNGVVLCERRIITDQDGLALEHTETRYAAARYEFESVLHRDSSDVIQ